MKRITPTIFVKDIAFIDSKSKGRLHADFDATPEGAKKGIRRHRPLIGIFLRIFGKAVKIQDKDSKIWYVNRSSLKKYLAQNLASSDYRFTNLNEILLKIKEYHYYLDPKKPLDEIEIKLIEADDEIKNNEEIFKKLLQRDGTLLQFAGDRIKDNLELVKIAVAQNRAALQFAHPRIKNLVELHEILDNLKNADKEDRKLLLQNLDKDYFSHVRNDSTPLDTIVLFIQENNIPADALPRFLFGFEKVFLAVSPNHRPLNETKSSFDALEMALKRAKLYAGVGADVKDLHLLAALYLMDAANIDADCHGEYVKLSDGVEMRDQVIDEDERERLLAAKDDELSESDQQRRDGFCLGVQSDGSQIYLNKKQDLASSLTHFNNPVAIKKAWESLPEESKAAFAFKLIEGSALNEDEAAFKALLHGMRDALLENRLDGNFIQIFKPFAEKAFKIFAVKGLITEENQYDLILRKRMGMLAALELLKNCTWSQENSKHTLLLSSEGINYRIPLDHMEYFFSKDNTKLPVGRVFPLSGKLDEEKDISSHAQNHEALILAQHLNQMPDAKRDLMTTLVERLAKAPFETPRKENKEVFEIFKKELTLEGNRPLFDRFQQMMEFSGLKKDNDIDFKILADTMIRLAEKVEILGALFSARYLTPHYNEFLGKLEFTDSGSVKNKESLASEAIPIIRTAKEHRDVIQKYFPGEHVPLLPRNPPPLFLNESEIEKFKLYNNPLFQKIDNPDHSYNNCLAVAIYQGMAELHDRKTFAAKPGFQDPSKSTETMRKAASHYMLEHPELFVDYVDIRKEQGKPITEKEKIEAVKKRARDIVSRNEPWMSAAEILAFSCIIGRPIHILNSDHRIYKIRNSSLEMTRFNDHFEHEPIYLNYSGNHYHLLLPKRIGVKDVA